jgi:nucleotide-binding universal stress UspA family protein
MNTVLIATDGSPAAEAAVEAAMRLAAEQGAKAVVLHVVEATDVRWPHRRGPVEATPHAVDDPRDDDALRRAAAVAREHRVPYELKLVSGLEVDTILQTADDVEAELVAIGSSRHRAAVRAILGSVAGELLRRSARPLLVVHPVDQSEGGGNQTAAST